ncbi:ribokinase [Acetobacter sp.]|jgi:ribokinase|uniref:ribokinase n=1 Tax=Acetobacter sp. TaxID=440 RepID=UPI0025B92AF8|nr:ribokinase [Acetobacter sp.]MCH4089972.1 ribokinase [Acetobacter sp.]MCI1298668.1 ribokinase [Acetobacter sp.]MCI1315233.1 ribokinase [Acetobacter sp.]
MPASRLILSFGSVNIDVTARGQRLPTPGETVHADSYTIGLGGKGANQAAAAARLGSGRAIQSALVGRIGADAFGAQARSSLETFGVELEALRTDGNAATGLALIGIDQQAENCITVVGGANLHVDEHDIQNAEHLFSRAAVLLLQLEVPVPAVLAAARKGRQAGARVILDPAPASTELLPDALWPLLDVITPNETETAALCGILPKSPEDADAATRLLLERGTKAVIIKMGARGVYWRTDSAKGFLPPFPVKAVDSVGAGDCFNAGLAVALADGLSFDAAVRVAAACGALAVTKHGAAEAAPEWNEVAALL